MRRLKFLILGLSLSAGLFAFAQPHSAMLFRGKSDLRFNILGVKGGTDSLTDAWFANTGDMLNVSWSDAPAETAYEVTVFENDGTTVRCPMVPLVADIVTYTFSQSGDCGGALTEASTYKLSIVGKKGGSSKQAANGMFNFTVDRVAPTVIITGNPTNPTDQTTATFTWTQSDATSGIASTECFLDTVSQGACTSPVNLTGLADGNHTFEVRVTDNAGNIGTASYTWNVNTIVISGGPNFNAFIGTAWLQAFSVTGGSGTFTWTLPLNPDTASVNTVPEVSFTPAVAGKRAYTIRATDTVSTNIKDHNFFVDVYESGLCLWTGTTSTAWATTSNWTNCGGGTPLTTSKIAISGWAPNMPILAATTTVDSFGLGVGGGTLTVGSVILGLSSTSSNFRSSATLKGQTTTCTNCRFATMDLHIINGATLTVDRGMTLTNSSSSRIYVGNSLTGGALIATGGTLNSEKPQFGSTSSWSYYSIILNGSSTDFAKLSLDGAKISFFQTGTSRIRFQNNYEISRMDNLIFQNSTPGTGSAFVDFENCTNSSLLDTNWDSNTFLGLNNGAFNIRASHASCSSLGPITVSNPPNQSGGAGYGEDFDDDPNSRVNWANDVQSCIWTGAISSTWTDPGNWDSCANGRGGVPEGPDYVIIPPTLNQPVVASSAAVRGFAATTLTAGGTITVNSGFSLSLTGTSSQIMSDVAFRGSAAGCTNCSINGSPTGAALWVTHGARLKLLAGARLNATWQQSIRIGNGSTGGALVADSSGPSSEWPSIGWTQFAGILLNGSAGNLATLDVSGLYVNGALHNYIPSAASLYFIDHYKIDRLERFTIDNSGTLSTEYPAIRFASCQNSQVNDTTWDDILLNVSPNVATGNIRADGASCSLLPTVTVSPRAGTSGGFGYGHLYEIDPNDKINWASSTSNDCVWTGSIDTSWTNPSNWAGCANGRQNYPDQLDRAVIPSGLTNQPSLTSTQVLHSFGGTISGGGTLTVNNSVLYLGSNSSAITRDITLRGQTPTCGSCRVQSLRELHVVEGAKVTLGSGIDLSSRWQMGIYLGNGTSGGKLATLPASSNTTEWPSIGAPSENFNLRLNGSTSDPSSLELDGIRLMRGYNYSGNVAAIHLMGAFDLRKMDNVYIDSFNYHTTNNAFVNFTTCANAQITDQQWTNWTFVDTPSGAAKNIVASNASCSTLTPINFVGSGGPGKGAAYENDPFNKIKWDAPTISAPTIFYGSVGVPWTYTFTATGGSGSYSYSLPTNPAGATVNASTGQVDFTPASAGAINFVVRVTDTISSETWDHAFSVHSYDSGVCLWTGTTSTAWTTASNWEFCGGGTPTTTSKIAIHSTAPNMPILAATTTVDSFGLGVGGGTLTINAGRNLQLGNYLETVRSRVAVRGATDSCTNCTVRAPNGATVSSGATLELLNGVNVATASTGVRHIRFGNGTTSGHLLAQGSGNNDANWPSIGSFQDESVIFIGSASNTSTASIDGLRMLMSSYSGSNRLDFQDYYQIQKLDRLRFKKNGATPSGFASIRFATCTNGIVSDISWTDMEFDVPVNINGANVRASDASCVSLPLISIANTSGQAGGEGYGEIFEVDPHVKLNWSNSAGATCVWTGLSSTTWTDPTNWSSCNNGRGDIPDSLDEVLIPPTPNSPTISSSSVIKGFAPSNSGGGTIVLNGNLKLTASTLSNIGSSVVLEPSNPLCGACSLTSSGSMRIHNQATLDLRKGVLLNGGSSIVIFVGNGVTGGTLRARGGALDAEKPRIGTGNSSTSHIEVRGASGSPSRLDIDGLRVLVDSYSTTPAIQLKDHFVFDQFDNVLIDVNSGVQNNESLIRFEKCDTATILDTSWDNTQLLDWVSQGGFNIDSSHATCAGLTAFTVAPPAGTSGGGGFGSVYEQDPFNRITWSNSATSDCEWTGAISTAWNNSGNWSNCSNGRGNVPDQLDFVFIPPTANQPVLAQTSLIRGFRGGSGGGTLTVNAGITLGLTSTTATVQSSVVLRGSADTCTNCRVLTLGDSTILNEAVLNLYRGVFFGPDSNTGRHIYVGNGSSGGKLSTGPSGASNTWPRLGSNNNGSIVVSGDLASPSVISLDGADIRMGVQSTTETIRFLGGFEIEKFDNLRFTPHVYGAASKSVLLFNSCLNGTISDTIWDNLEFAVGGGLKNIVASDASCSSLPTTSLINYFGPGACGNVGAGACALENDPHNKFSWD